MRIFGPGDIALAFIYGSLFLAAALTSFTDPIILMLGFAAGYSAVRKNWMVTLARLGLLVLMGAAFTAVTHTVIRYYAAGPATSATVFAAGPLEFVATSSRPGDFFGAWILGASMLPGRKILRENRQGLKVVFEALRQIGLQLWKKLRSTLS